ncbi:tripartite tricarboxylate transporter permease [Natronorarus salvus]|uniref:tripartite tricarboxylate transporter permease n=1 Tax=Natronorarus salvus TaxID=3117733 RepID=UPI002F267056
MTFGVFVEAVGVVLSWPTIGWVVAGILIGIVVGALPGLGASLGMAILLPLTLPLDGTDAIILLIGIYSGAMYGGSIAAILINAPGTSAAAATTFDGYPMSRQGKAVTALSLSATASALAGFLTVAALILFSPVLVEFVLAFGTPERFLIAILGLAMITIVARGSMVKGLLAGFFGLALTTVGSAPMTGDVRYTFGQFALYDGISFIAALIGLFAVAEMLKLANETGGISKRGFEVTGEIGPGVRSVLGHPLTVVKSAFIGMGIGAIPGAGSTVSNFVAYTEAVRASSDPESFGKGNEVGVIASEASNNGTIGGSVIPAIAFGIPGSAATAVLIGGLIMHGLNPGPALFDVDANLDVTFAVFVALLIGNVFILAIGLLVVTRVGGALTQIDTDYIIPMVIVLSFLGAFALNNGRWVDVITIVGLGVIGFYMKKYDYSIIAFVLGVVLGGIAEENLFRSLILTEGTIPIFFTKPLSLAIVVVIVLILATPFLQPWLEARRS